MESSGNISKTRAEIKAERREKQELQRAAKLAKKNNKANKEVPPKFNDESVLKTIDKPIDEETCPIISLEVERLSIMWTKDHFLDSTCLTISMIDSLTKLLTDSDPSVGEVLKVVDGYINCCSSKISLPADAESFINYLKSCIPITTNKEFLVEALDSFRKKRLISAVECVGDLTKRVLKLHSVKSVAVFSYTMSVMAALIDWDPLDELEVYLIECSSTKSKAAILKDRLTKDGIIIRYANLSGIDTILRNVDLVLIGAETVYSDGSIRAALGSSVVLLMAKFHKIPIYVLYETIKLSVQVCSPEMVSDGFEVVSRRLPMTFISENDIHSAILGFSRRSVNIHT